MKKMFRMNKKTFAIIIFAIILASVVLFYPTVAETVKTPFGEMKINITLGYKNGKVKELSVANNLMSFIAPATIYVNGNEIEYIEYHVWVKAYGSFSHCDLDYKDSKIGWALYERNSGASYPNNPPLTMMTYAGHTQSNGGTIDMVLNTGSGESGWYEMYNLHVEETSQMICQYTDEIDYKLSFFMNGPLQYRGRIGEFTSSWQIINTVPITMSDVFFSITPDGEPPPPNTLTIISGPELDNTVIVSGVGTKVSSNGRCTFELQNGQYAVTISHAGYQPYQNFDVYVNGPTTLGPVSLSESQGTIYTVVVGTIPYADYIDCEGVNNDYFSTNCENGIGIFVVPEPGTYKCTAGWDDLDPHEKYKNAYPSSAIPTYSIVIVWSQTASILSYFTLESADMETSFEQNGYYLGRI